MIDWKDFRYELPPSEGVYLYVGGYGGWKRANWRDGKWTESCGANRIALVEPTHWAKVELP
jgi:hypothetical protein